jgi:hypothetical protein
MDVLAADRLTIVEDDEHRRQHGSQGAHGAWILASIVPLRNRRPQKPVPRLLSLGSLR